MECHVQLIPNVIQEWLVRQKKLFLLQPIVIHSLSKESCVSQLMIVKQAWFAGTCQGMISIIELKNVWSNMDYPLIQPLVGLLSIMTQ